MKKKIVAMGLVLSMLAALTACGTSEGGDNASSTPTPTPEGSDDADSTQTQESGDAELPLAGEHFVFGINATFAPFEYVDGADENGDEILAGFDIDLVEKFSEMLGFTYEFNDMEFNGLIGAISSGRCDIIVSGISINDERDEVVDASDPYFYPKTAILSYADSEYTDLDSLIGHSVAVSMGTVYAMIVNDIDGIEVKELDSTALAFQELANGTVDACLFDANQCGTFIGDYPEMNLVRDVIPTEISLQYAANGYCVLVPEGETELLAYFDEAIDELQESGWLDELIVKWCGEDYLD